MLLPGGRDQRPGNAKVHPDPPLRKLRAPGLLEVVQGTAHRFERRLGHVRVDLRGTRALVTEKFLDDAEVGAPFQAERAGVFLR